MHVGSGASLTEIQQLYEARLSDFVRTAAAICGSREAGRDATHDAFVSALRNRQRFARGRSRHGSGPPSSIRR
jgi:DNA-directed RNA polymerase specialized sigma24 family protein